MPGKAEMTLTMTDVYGDKLKGRVDIRLDHKDLGSADRVKNDYKPPKRFTIENLTPGIYDVCIFPSLYYPVRKFVNVRDTEPAKVSFTLPVDAEKVMGIEAPDFNALPQDLQEILKISEIQSKRGETLYNWLDDEKKAGLLNISSKMRMTTFRDGRNVLSFVKGLDRIRGDRFFTHVQNDLRDEVKNTISRHLFHKVPNMDHDPPHGYEKAGSYKTADKYGNLQLTFFKKIDAISFMVDADIDDASGLEHNFQVIEHYLSGKETSPYDIHEILLKHQKLDPGYRLLV